MGIDLLLRTVLRFLTFHWLQDRFSKCKLIRMVDFEGLNRLLGQMCKSCVYRQDQFYQNQDQEPKMFAIENVRSVNTIKPVRQSQQQHDIFVRLIHSLVDP